MSINKKTVSDQWLSTEDWIELAKQTLISEGLSGVKVDRLAKKAGVTRGGFYYRFKSREALLDAVLKHWQATNHKPIVDALSGPGTPPERFRSLVRLWLDERDFDPDYDAAIRSWSQISPKVAQVVHKVDDLRINALKKLFVDAGYDDDEAFIRARITYFHQVGYYSMGVRESSKRRQELSELYYRVLTGFRNTKLNYLSADPETQDDATGERKAPARKRKSRSGT